MKTFNDYKFRCHYQGDLISVPKPLTDKQAETLEAYRNKANLTEKQNADWHSLEGKLAESKVFKLNDTAKSLCTQIVFNEKWGRKTTLKNKYFDKGIRVEKKGRDLLSEVLGTLLTFDPETKENEWVKGKRDINANIIIDIKSSYDFNTFNAHLLEKKHEYYFRQLDCYMELWKTTESILAFVLVDTPPDLIESELKRMDYYKDILNIEGNVREEKISEVKDIISSHIFTREGLEEFCIQSPNVNIEWFDDFIEIPKQERVHLLSHNFDKIRIQQRNECLTLCREFMNTIEPINNLKIN